MRKKKVLVVGITTVCLSIAGLSIAAAHGGQHELVKNSAVEQQGQITFVNNGSNVQAEQIDDNLYINTISARLSGGSTLNAVVNFSHDLNGSTDYIAKLYNSTIHFSETSTTEYKFQNITGLTIYTDCERDFTLLTSTNGTNFSSIYVSTNEDGIATSSISNARYLRIQTNGDMEIPLKKIVLNYSCSYDYTEQLTGVQTVTIYASNDIHGAIPENGDEVGLETYATFFKNKGAQPNTLLLDQGDSWQGSIYSNINYGNLVNDVMIEAGWDVRTVGNHDFDWGTDKLIANTARQYKGKTLTTLAANVYDYDFDTKTFGTTHQSNIGQKTATFTLENGVKVGVVGVIGKDQITSINSLYVHDIGFTDHIQVIKDEATNLRNAGCHIVIASCHCGQEDVKGQGLEEYVDLVLCGHTHKAEVSNENGIYYGQFYHDTKCAGEIVLTYDADAGVVTDTTVNKLYSSSIRSAVTSIDPTIHNLITGANSSCDLEASQIVANNVTGTFESGKNTEYTIEDLMAQAIYDTAVAEGYTDVVCSFINDSRCTTLTPTNGKLTYADIYEAFPFDNTVYIIEASKKEMLNEIGGYNFACFSQDFINSGKTVKAGNTYKVACLDYLAFHTNSNRSYNFFPDNNGRYIGTLSKNYRLILKDWLTTKGYNSGTALDPSNFEKSSTKFNNKGQITEVFAYDLTYMMNDGTDDVFETVGNVPSNAYISDYVPYYNPSRQDYAFGGWYMDAGCTTPIGSNTVTSDLTLYAKWVSAGSYVTGDITHQNFVEGATSTNVTATNNVGDTKTIILNHSSMEIGVDNTGSNYQNTCFLIPAQGFMCAHAPNGYKITSLQIRAYRTYDNFNFYAGDAVDEGNELDEEQTKASSAPYYINYVVAPNSNSVYIFNNYTIGAMYCYEMNITIEHI